MATRLYLRALGSDYGTGNNDANLRATATGWDNRALSLTAGSSAVATGTVTPTAASTASWEFVLTGGVPAVWYSPPLDADVTISGSIVWNLWAFEFSMSTNAAINGRLEVIDGATGVITLIDQTARVTEAAISTAAVNNFAETPAAGVLCKRGDRLRVRPFAAPVGSFAAEAVTFHYDGTVAQTRESWLELTENLAFVSEPAGSTVYPTNTASDVAGALVEREAWTSRGAGVQNDVVNSVAGFTAPIQWTDTAGGTAVEWYTKPLTAFTIGGAVRVNVRALESVATVNASARCEIARVEGDGTGASVWASGTFPTEIGTTESARSFLVSGDDIAIADGQRLRIRLLIDDYGVAAMAAGTVTLFYAGAAGATGDTYLTLSQTLTEFIVSNDKTYAAVLKGGGIVTIARTHARSRTQAMTGGGITTVATRKAAARTQAMTGGGVVVTTGVKFIPEVHTGTATLTGGGIIVAVGVKSEVVTKTYAATLTGGGVITRVGVKKAVRTQPMTGGGIATVARAAARRTTATATGGGVVTVTRTFARRSTAVLTGGGRITYTYAAGTNRSAFVVLTGGGTITSTRVKKALRTQVMTGGGVAVIAAAAVSAPARARSYVIVV